MYLVLWRLLFEEVKLERSCAIFGSRFSHFGAYGGVANEDYMKMICGNKNASMGLKSWHRSGKLKFLPLALLSCLSHMLLLCSTKRCVDVSCFVASFV